MIVPSLAIIYTISLFLDAFMSNQFVTYAFTGIKCAVAFLILRAGVNMFAKLDKKALPMTVFSIVLVGLLLLELFSMNFSSIVLILIGGIIGIIAYAIPKKKEDVQ